MRDYWRELSFWFFLALAITLIAVGFKGLLKVLVGSVPAPAGFKEALAA